MHTSLALLAGVLSSAAVRAEPSDKRGLVYVPNDHFPQDDSIWVRDGSDLTWYYNYAPTPSDSYNDKSQADFEFVPMLFGPTEGTAFLDTINNLIDGGRQIEHVLSFNEPDGPAQYGGSNMAPEVAAQIWVDNLIPLREKGIKVGLPACTGAPGGIVWLESFLESCSNIAGKECDYDFVAIHWYGNFEGLASHLGEYAAKFPNKTQWVTEYALAHEELTPTQYFYQTSAEYMDRLTNVDRYSYFGSFRSAVSNVGPNAVMLNNDGQLTDIGSWYLGGSATGVDPQSGSQASSDSAATRIGGRAVDMVSAVGVAIVGCLLLGIA